MKTLENELDIHLRIKNKQANKNSKPTANQKAKACLSGNIY
jgi:hypothetical protein